MPSLKEATPPAASSNGFPTPPAWLTIIIAAALGYGGARYDAGKLENRVETLEKYDQDDRATKKQEALAREARYLAAEAERNRQKDSEVQEIARTAQELKELLNTRTNGPKP